MLNSSIYFSPNRQKLRNSSMIVSFVYGTSIYYKNTQVVSPNNSRVIQLNENSLNYQQMRIEHQKATYEAKLNSINQKVQIAHNNDLSRLQSLQDQLNKIEETLRNDQIIKNEKQNKIYQQTNSKNFRQNTLKEQESSDKVRRKLFEKRLTKLMDEKSYKMRLEQSKQQQYRKETESHYRNEIENRIQNLSVDVRNEKREILYQGFVGRREQLFSVQETLNQEKHQRQESQNKMKAMIQEISNNLNLQLAEEQIQRDETERTMIRLLNETCNRVENSLRR